MADWRTIITDGDRMCGFTVEALIEQSVIPTAQDYLEDLLDGDSTEEIEVSVLKRGGKVEQKSTTSLNEIIEWLDVVRVNTPNALAVRVEVGYEREIFVKTEDIC